MSQTERLERLLTDQLGECCAADVQQRRTELSALRDRTGLDRTETDVRALSALGDDTRYRLTRLLAEGGERCVCELEAVVDVSESAVSHALSDLVEAGLLSRRKEGRWRYYATTDRAEAILAALDTTEGER